jgi:hypothetical protein
VSGFFIGQLCCPSIKSGYISQEIYVGIVN